MWFAMRSSHFGDVILPMASQCFFGEFQMVFETILLEFSNVQVAFSSSMLVCSLKHSFIRRYIYIFLYIQNKELLSTEGYVMTLVFTWAEQIGNILYTHIDR